MTILLSIPCIYATAVDCFCVTESWLNTNINNGEVLPANYTIYHHDRDTRGGGVLIAVLDKIPSKQIVIDCELDIILVQLEVLPRILVCCVYNPQVVMMITLTDYWTSYIPSQFMVMC